MVVILLLGLTTLVAGLSSLLGVALLRQQGRILTRLDAIEQALLASQLRRPASVGALSNVSAPPDPSAMERASKGLEHSRLNRGGLAIGTRAPDFALPRVDGLSTLALRDCLGSPFVLVFSDPHCAPCQQLASDLNLAAARYGRLPMLIVSRGTAEENSKKLGPDVLTFPPIIQEGWNLSRIYATFKLPSAYLISEDGIIQSELVVGPAAITDLVLARTILGRRQTGPPLDRVPQQAGVQ